jgi:hypothetical protein
MPGTQAHAHTPRARHAEPQPMALQTPEPASAKRDLTSWWRQFSKRPTKKEDEKGETAPRRPAWAFPALQTHLRRLSACPTAPAPSPTKPPSHAFADLYCYTQKCRQESSVCPSSRAYRTPTLRSRCSTSTGKATSTATCPLLSQNAACT